ncbi:unnamed protein product, partial [Larinioides sclopetarius]
MMDGLQQGFDFFRYVFIIIGILSVFYCVNNLGKRQKMIQKSKCTWMSYVVTGSSQTALLRKMWQQFHP